MGLKVVCSRFAEHIGRKLAKEPYNLEVLFTGVNKDGKREFPDQEMYFRLNDYEKLAGQRVVIITCGQPKPADCLFELDLLIAKAEASGAKKIEVFFLYFPFARADNVFNPDEINVANIVCERYKKYKIYTIHPHFGNREWIKGFDLHIFSAEKLIIKEIENKGFSNFKIIAPDIGEADRSGNLSFSKKRIDSNTVETKATPELIEEIEGKTIVLKDDIISTGGTMVRCGIEAKKYASKVIASVTHAVLPAGVKKVKASFDGNLFITNTIPNEYANVDVTPLVYEAIK